jgi:hypothetical protein
MKKTFAKTGALVAVAAVAAMLSFASPASAAPFYPGFDNINARQAQIAQQIDWGQRSGRLTFMEARDLRGEMRQIDFLEMRYRRDGLNFGERADLDRRLDRLSFEVQREMNDRDVRGDRHYDRHGF